MSTGEIELAPGVSIEYTAWKHTPRAGLLIWHRTPAGDPCVGTVLFDRPGAADHFPGRPLWTVEQEEPLTVSPSVLCSCGHHGWIRGGTWEPA